MAFCSKCGSEVANGAAFCPKCGQAQTGGEVAQTSHSAESGLSENVAGLLCYVLGWVTGIIFLLIDKRPYVRFHAAQSIVVFGGLHVINIIIGILFGARVMMGGWGTFGVAAELYSLINLLTLILCLLLSVKSYHAKKFQVPVARGFA